jgi:hypothetical protein
MAFKNSRRTGVVGVVVMESSKVSSRSREKVLGDLRIGRILSNGKGAPWVI